MLDMNFASIFVLQIYICILKLRCVINQSISSLYISRGLISTHHLVVVVIRQTKLCKNFPFHSFIGTLPEYNLNI